jgi:Fic family protein
LFLEKIFKKEVMKMTSFQKLTNINGFGFYYNDEYIKPKIEILEKYINDFKPCQSKSFAIKNLRFNEVHFNNLVEGYNDDINTISSVLKEGTARSEKEQRIINLHNGYNYISKGKTINEDNLKELYDILSKNLLTDDELKTMGAYYRNKTSHIFYSKYIHVPPDTTLDASKIPFLMDNLFDYINTNNEFDMQTDYFIKSMIIHFYFVYIHPYYDVNGRTSRTTSIWYMLNNNIFPFVIFNRSYSNISEYYKLIREAKFSYNLTKFLNYNLEKIELELEKEYVISKISDFSKLSVAELEIVRNIIGLHNNNKNVLALKIHLHLMGNKLPVSTILNEMLIPLFDKNILLKERETSRKIDGDTYNFTFDLNYNNLDIDSEMVKSLEKNNLGIQKK